MTTIQSLIRSRYTGRRLSQALSRLHGRLTRYRSAYAYARGHLTPDQAGTIIWECQDVTGAYPLITLNAADVLDDAREKWGDHPEFERLCGYAAQRVANKWEDYTEVRSSCAEWALDMVADYAAAEGITLTEIDA